MLRVLAVFALVATTAALATIALGARGEGAAQPRAVGGDDASRAARGDKAAGDGDAADAARGNDASRGGGEPADGGATGGDGATRGGTATGDGGAADATPGGRDTTTSDGGAADATPGGRDTATGDGSAADASRGGGAARRATTPAVAWRSSRALGTYTRGRLVRGVKLPVRGAHFLTWDPVRKRTPNRWWRRYGTDALVRVLLHVVDGYAKAHPRAPRLLIGDLSRPRGGDFGRRYGPLGHVSHQNGLDADVYFPRTDGRERAPRSAAQVDRRLAQDLVHRFRRAGAALLLAGASLDLEGTQPWPHHDDHVHVRLGS